MSRRKTLVDQTLALNNTSYINNLNRLTELAITSIGWKRVPKTIDTRYVELELFEKGCVVYFNDDVIGNLCLDCLPGGQYDCYGNPILRRAYSSYNNYQKLLKKSNSVIIWNNYLRKNSFEGIRMFALRMANIERIIDVNVNAQKTPVLVQGTEKQRLTLENLYMQYDGNIPFIFGDKSLNNDSLKTIQTGAPYISDKLYELKVKVWNEALTFLGISNESYVKKERMIQDEVQRSQGGTIASRYSRVKARQNAVAEINDMFGTDIEVGYNNEVEGMATEHMKDSMRETEVLIDEHLHNRG